jgi:HAD superfamily hydrolase (TIGR01509 family)
MIKALIFDFDGLIIDTESAEFQSWQETFDEHGCALTFEDWSICIGTTAEHHDFDPCEHLEQLYGRPLDRESVHARRRERMWRLIEDLTLLEGVEHYLSEGRQRGLRIGLASSSPRWWIEAHLGRLGLLDRFDYIRTRTDVSRGKPDPELYQNVLDAFDCTGIEAIAFEDSPNGIRAARAAGIYTVAVPNPLTRRLDVSHASLCLPSLAAMPLADLITLIE